MSFENLRIRRSSTKTKITYKDKEAIGRSSIAPDLKNGEETNISKKLQAIPRFDWEIKRQED